MKLLFCHDGPISVDKEGNAYPKTFTEEVLSRYYYIADEITMFLRTKIIDLNKYKIPKVNMESLNIIDCPNLSSIKSIIKNRKIAKQKLKKELQDCDYLIARLPSQIGNMAVDMAIALKKPYLIELVACPW